MIQSVPEKDVDGNVIRLGMGKVARQVLINIHKTLSGFGEEGNTHKEYLNLLQDEDRRIDIEDGVTITIGDMRITPILVDHSAYDAYMFIIEADGKTIVHLFVGGDFDKCRKRYENTRICDIIDRKCFGFQYYQSLDCDMDFSKKAFEL